MTRLLPLLLCIPSFLLVACGSESSPRIEFDSDVEECRARLKTIYDGLRVMKTEQGLVPTEPGARFFAVLIASGQWEDTPENRARLSCAGVNVPPREFAKSFADLASVTGEDTAYAGRDTRTHPLAAFPTRGTEPLIACDNSTGMNHDGVVNVLYADGSIKTWIVEQERERGSMGPDEDVIWIGPNSQVEDLRKLTLD